MKFEELFKHKPGSVGAEMQKTIDRLNEEIKQLRRQVAHQAKLESENAKLKKELEWKTKRMKTLADGLHGIEDVLKKTAASLFRDAVEDGSEDDPLEVENAALRAAAVEVCALARVWATVWHDKLSTESLQRFAELEQQVLRRAQP
jgi:predicted nuclease with TOPRIM domain